MPENSLSMVPQKHFFDRAMGFRDFINSQFKGMYHDMVINASSPIDGYNAIKNGDDQKASNELFELYQKNYDNGFVQITVIVVYAYSEDIESVMDEIKDIALNEFSVTKVLLTPDKNNLVDRMEKGMDYIGLTYDYMGTLHFLFY